MPCWVEKNECGADLQTLQGRALRIFAGTAPSLYDYRYCMLQGLPGLPALYLRTGGGKGMKQKLPLI